jgi:hypothetical protein
MRDAMFDVSVAGVRGEIRPLNLWNTNKQLGRYTNVLGSCVFEFCIELN